MRALVKATAAPGFVLKDVPVPTHREHEVLIKVKAAGVCGTDVHIHEWDAWAQGRCKPPFTVGHEFAGVVEKVGSLVTDVKVGDRVLFGKYSGQEFKLDGQDLLHMREDDIIGIVAR